MFAFARYPNINNAAARDYVMGGNETDWRDFLVFGVAEE